MSGSGAGAAVYGPAVTDLLPAFDTSDGAAGADSSNGGGASRGRRASGFGDRGSRPVPAEDNAMAPLAPRQRAAVAGGGYGAQQLPAGARDDGGEGSDIDL